MRPDGVFLLGTGNRQRFSVLRLLLINIWLRLTIIRLRLQCAYLDWRLRRRGIDPDSIPGSQELRRQLSMLRSKPNKERD